jgi:Na+-translocating ferredoxin:NAD+ oxidoreductase RnfE subunit
LKELWTSAITLRRGYLLGIINEIMGTGMILESWLRKKVVPILNPRKDLELLDSYSPISLLPCGRKLLERMLCTRLDYWAEKYDVLSSSQYGFRKGRGTTYCLTLLTTNVQTSFERKQQTVAAFIDISRAYDIMTTS